MGLGLASGFWFQTFSNWLWTSFARFYIIHVATPDTVSFLQFSGAALTV